MAQKEGKIKPYVKVFSSIDLIANGQNMHNYMAKNWQIQKLQKTIEVHLQSLPWNRFQKHYAQKHIVFIQTTSLKPICELQTKYSFFFVKKVLSAVNKNLVACLVRNKLFDLKRHKRKTVVLSDFLVQQRTYK